MQRERLKRAVKKTKRHPDIEAEEFAPGPSKMKKKLAAAVPAAAAAAPAPLTQPLTAEGKSFEELFNMKDAKVAYIPIFFK